MKWAASLALVCLAFGEAHADKPGERLARSSAEGAAKVNDKPGERPARSSAEGAATVNDKPGERPARSSAEGAAKVNDKPGERPARSSAEGAAKVNDKPGERPARSSAEGAAKVNDKPGERPARSSAEGAAKVNDKAAAEAFFVKAKELDRAGDVAGACPLFEASYRADPQLGVLLNLANCHEQLGKTGVAWAEFRESIEMAARKSDPREDFARRRAAALEPRLVRLHVEAAATPGLRVHRGDADMLVGQDVVVDPGTYTIEAFATGYRTWTTSVEVAAEGTVATIAVPMLEAAPKPAVLPPKPALAIKPTTRDSSPLRTWGLVVGGVGLGVVATGLGVGAYAWSEWQGTRDPAVCDHSNICSPAGQAQIASSRSHARTSTYLVAAGGVTVAASLVMFLVAPRGEHTTVVAPAFDDHSAGVSISGGF